MTRHANLQGLRFTAATPMPLASACSLSFDFSWPAHHAGIDIYPMTLEFNFRFPIMREWLLLHGVVDASRQVCEAATIVKNSWGEY